MIRYDAETDDMTEVDQKWCDTMQKQAGLLAIQREIVRCVSSLNVSTQQEVLTLIWGYIRSLGIADTVAEAMEDAARRRELSRAISDGLNAALNGASHD